MSDADARFSSLPNPWTVLLPSRAYLLSVRQQTLPSRRFAIEDADARHAAATQGGDLGLQDMALLGLIGETLQVIEDIGYFGSAYGTPTLGLAHYVTATVFNDRTPNNFFSSFKNRTSEQIKVLTGLWIQDPETGESRPIHDAVGVTGLDGEDRAAILEAEDGTVSLIRPYLLALATAWEQYRRYFHAYKHGGLTMSREDFQLVDDHGEEQVTSLQIWRKASGEPTGWGDTELTASDVAEQVRRTASLALGVFEYLVDARAATLETLVFEDDGSIRELRQPSSFWTFWFHEAQVSERTKTRLLDRFGFTLTPYH